MDNRFQSYYGGKESLLEDRAWLSFPRKIIQFRRLHLFWMQNMATLCKTYAFEPDMVITFDIRPEDDIEGNRDIWIDVQTPPVLPLCEFFSTIFLSLILLIQK